MSDTNDNSEELDDEVFEETNDEVLKHYGVVGMKWGKRSGGLKSRVRGAAIDSVQRRLTTNKEIAAGRGQKRDYYRTSNKRLGGVITGGNTKRAAKRTVTLEARMERITTGKTKASDILDGLINTPVTDLLVSRRDKRGEPGSIEAKQNTGSQKAANILLGVGTVVAITLIKNAAKNKAQS